ncbi:hypothetical protein Mterra_03394 [Calidithermus terrae]|uniref:Uncharacterized protein n=1 Tax=Calidithermus terrae TaxID=1408545 RepID=A0A399EFT1_9DEIN|nr:hypothetical protein Mterra_03394 [Calidithermus terrae]
MDRVEAALEQALTTAIRQVYQIGVVIVLLGLAVTLFIPELPLRRSNAPAPAAAD